MMDLDEFKNIYTGADKVDELFERNDMDEDGLLDFDDFVAAMLEPQLINCFHNLDEDDNGHLTKPHVEDVINSVVIGDLPDDIIQNVVDKIDTDGDGTIDLDEFLAAIVGLRHLYEQFKPEDKDQNKDLDLTEFYEHVKKMDEVKPKVAVTDEQKDKLYGLHKQVTEGDINHDEPVDDKKPGLFKSKTMHDKYDAWHDQIGKPKEEAAAEYVDLVKEILKNQDEAVDDYAKKLKDADPHITHEDECKVDRLYN
jgi:acyl-CoA-binding protein